MGMGNAMTALADDADAVFYNAAGISYNSGVELRVLNPKLESSADNLKLADELKDVGSNGFSADAMKALFGKNLYVNGTIFPSLLVPHLTIGYYADFNFHASINNQAYPSIDLNYYYDQGLVTGTGFETGGFGKFHHIRFGLTMKMLSRRGVSRKVPITTLAEGGSAVRALTSNSGLGFGFDPGLIYEMPSGPMSDLSFGVSWHDLGDTKFGTRLANTSRLPPSIKGNLAAGAAWIHRLSKTEGRGIKFALEGRHLNRSGEDPRKKIHAGAELEWGLFSLQAGVNQLHWTAGLGLDLWFVEVRAATYAVDVAPLWGQDVERRYAAQVIFKLDATGSRDRSKAAFDRRKRPRLNSR